MNHTKASTLSLASKPRKQNGRISWPGDQSLKQNFSLPDSVIYYEMGKPSKEYFHNALKALGEKPEDVVMIGDDIVSDIGETQKLGIHGIQVRTGKYMLEFSSNRFCIKDISHKSKNSNTKK